MKRVPSVKRAKRKWLKVRVFFCQSCTKRAVLLWRETNQADFFGLIITVRVVSSSFLEECNQDTRTFQHLHRSSCHNPDRLRYHGRRPLHRYLCFGSLLIQTRSLHNQ